MSSAFVKDPASDNLGTTIWDASVILVRYMERNPQLYSRRKLEGKRVLELGAGCGLAGMYFALQGAHVTFTDLVREGLRFGCTASRPPLPRPVHVTAMLMLFCFRSTSEWNLIYGGRYFSALQVRWDAVML